jgi:hypothetical protein
MSFLEGGAKCPEGKVRNPKTGRCILKKKTTGKKMKSKSLKKRSPKKSLGELSQKDFFRKIDLLEKKGDRASMLKRQKMLENILM